MAYTLTQARKILTAAELQVFDASRAQPIRALTAARLRSKITRTRGLRDKYRDLYRRQSVATRGASSSKRSAVGANSERTQHKAELFAEVLARFEERLRKLQDAVVPSAGGNAGNGSPPKAVSASTARSSSTPKHGSGKVRPEPIAGGVAGQPQVFPAKAPTKRASSDSPATAPVDVVPSTKRTTPFRRRADNMAMHAHAMSEGRRVQARRDAR